jgi:predicted HTH transcriptional regulator
LEFNETHGLIREENNQYLPTTTGLLFIGNAKALRQLPYNQLKYIRYREDGTYTPFEYSGDLISMADACFSQLKSEINFKEFTFGLFREYVEDYPEIAIRELLINALAHRDYSRQQIIEIRKYPTYLEIESPGLFPEGITSENYLRKSNPRNPNIMDVLREINYAEKAGSGFDKIFVALLTKGKELPRPEETDCSIIFRLQAESYHEKLIELSVQYRNLRKREIDLESILVLNAIYTGKHRTLKELEETPYINRYQLKRILDDLLEIEFIEITGKTSGLKYLIHKSKLIDSTDERQYLSQKKQERFRQQETLLRYLDEFEEIDNQKAREILTLPDTQASYISRLLAEMVEKEIIEVAREIKHNQRIYRRVKA